jgi:hypothetical protein
MAAEMTYITETDDLRYVISHKPVLEFILDIETLHISLGGTHEITVRFRPSRCFDRVGLRAANGRCGAPG